MANPDGVSPAVGLEKGAGEEGLVVLDPGLVQIRQAGKQEEQTRN
jgi:hypothetical protein